MSDTDNKEKEEVICPWCGGHVVKYQHGYACNNNNKDDANSCRFFLSKKAFGGITDADVKNLCKVKKTKYKTMTSKTSGKPYKARIVANDDHTFSLEFDDGKTNMKCPKCGNEIIRFAKGYKCSNSECDFIVWNTMARNEIEDTQLRKLIQDGTTDEIQGFLSKKDKAFDARLKLDEDFHVVFDFSDEF